MRYRDSRSARSCEEPENEARYEQAELSELAAFLILFNLVDPQVALLHSLQLLPLCE